MKINAYLSALYSYAFQWLEKKLITPGEHAAFEKYIQNRREEIRPHRTTLIRRMVILLYSMGIILVLAGGVYFIASNWGGLHKFVKFTLILLGMAIFYVSGMITTKRFPTLPFLGKILTFSGTFFFGIALALTGQMYNIHANSAALFLIWLVPSIIFAYMYDFEPYYSLSVILLNSGVWFFFFPANNLWIMITYNWFIGFFILIVINAAVFLIGSLVKKKKKGISVIYISYIMFHLYFYFISFKFVSEDSVYIVNTIYILAVISCFIYLFKQYRNRFLSFYTLVMVVIYLITKYFEIIIFYAIDDGLTTELFITMIVCGLLLIPLSILLIKFLLKFIRKSNATA